MHPEPGSIVLVTWRDAAKAEGAWQTPHAAKKFKPVTVYSTGFLVIATERRVTLAMSVNPEQVGNTFTIPRDWVQEMEVLVHARK